MLVKTTQYKSSGISSANLLRALEIFDLPSAISPELNKCPGNNPVYALIYHIFRHPVFFSVCILCKWLLAYSVEPFTVVLILVVIFWYAL